ncbi:MAG TPA: carbonic anhydrase [Bryobacteraceae bacterium]|jgi:carbonic anhydrase
MQNLIDGFLHFKHHVLPREKQLFRDLGARQNPQALFITCSDSRIVPTLITQSRPGDLFVSRTIGNRIPAYGASADGGVASAVEYALEVLDVRDVIVCGHSDCGAMKAVLRPERTAALPATRTWLEDLEAVRSAVVRNYPDASDDVLLHVLTEENIAAQLRNLKSHPSVAVRLASGQLTLHGWFYHIQSGEITSYDKLQRVFRPLGTNAASTASISELQQVARGDAA